MFQHMSFKQNSQLSGNKKWSARDDKNTYSGTKEQASMRTCRTTSGAPSSMIVVDLNGLETSTRFFALSAEHCCTIL